jgi:hypothetical protein
VGFDKSKFNAKRFAKLSKFVEEEGDVSTIGEAEVPLMMEVV